MKITDITPPLPTRKFNITLSGDELKMLKRAVCTYTIQNPSAFSETMLDEIRKAIKELGVK